MRSWGTLALVALVGCKGGDDDVGEELCLSLAGSDLSFATLGEAIAAASAGDTIEVCNGFTTLADTIQIDKDLSLVGNGAGRSIIRPPANLPTFIVAPGVHFTAERLTLQGTQNVVEADDATLTFVDVHFEAPGHYAVHADDTAVTASGIEVTSARWGGLRVHGGSLDLQDSLFSGVSAFAVDLDRGATATIARNQFLNGAYTTTSGGEVNLDGFGVHGAGNAVLSLQENTFTGNTLGGVLIEGARIEMQGDRLSGNWAGLWIDRGQQVRLTDVDVEGGYVYGIVLLSSFDVTFEDVNVALDPSTSATDDPTTAEENEGSFGVRAVDANVVWTGGTVSGGNSGGVLATAQLTTGLTWDLTDVSFDNNGQLGFAMLLGTLTAENLQVTNTRDDPACLVDGFLNCNFATLLVSANATLTGGAILDNGSHGHVLFDSTLQWTDGQVSRHGEYAVYVADSTFTASGTRFEDAGSAGIFASGATVTLSGVDFSEGSSSYRYDLGDGTFLEVDNQGADVIADFDSVITVTDSTFTGGDRGIDGFFATVDVRNSTFTDYASAAIANYLGPISVRDVEIDGAGAGALTCVSGDLDVRGLTVRNAGRSVSAQRVIAADGTAGEDEVFESLGAAFTASSCPMFLEDILVEDVVRGGVDLATSAGEIDGLTLRNIGGGAGVAALRVDYASGAASLVANDIRVEGGDASGLRFIGNAAGAGRADDDVELSRLRVGTAEAPVPGGAILVQGLRGASLSGLAAYTTGGAGLTVADAAIAVTGAASGLPGEVSGDVGLDASGLDTVLRLTNLSASGTSGEGLRLLDGDFELSGVTASSVEGFGMSCAIADEAEDDGLAREASFDACDTVSAEGALGEAFACDACLAP